MQYALEQGAAPAFLRTHKPFRVTFPEACARGEHPRARADFEFCDVFLRTFRRIVAFRGGLGEAESAGPGGKFRADALAISARGSPFFGPLASRAAPDERVAWRPVLRSVFE